MKKTSILLIAVWLTLFSTALQGQTISTYAGGVGGSGSATGDGGAATAAGMRSRGITIDRYGSVYLADEYNHVVRKITAAGIISTIAGTGTAGFSGDGGAATAAKLYGPTHVAVDTAGNVYISDNRNSWVRKVSASGVITTFAGTGTA